MILSSLLPSFPPSSSTHVYAIAGTGTGGWADILKIVVQLLHRTVLPRAVSGTTKILRHANFGHMIRRFFTEFIIISNSVVARFAA